MTVTVYTKPNCPSCKLTKRKLDSLGIAYEEREIDEAVLLRAEAAGITAAPIVEAVGFPPFGGFRPDSLAKLVA